MKEKFMQIPAPLRRQILLRCAGAGLGVAMFLIVLIYSTDWRFMVPCAAAAVFCLSSAALLFDRCIRGKYVVITGICTEIDRTSIRKRIKAIYLQTEEHQIKLVGVRPVRNLIVGDTTVSMMRFMMRSFANGFPVPGRKQRTIISTMRMTRPYSLELTTICKEFAL